MIVIIIFYKHNLHFYSIILYKQFGWLGFGGGLVKLESTLVHFD